MSTVNAIAPQAVAQLDLSKLSSQIDLLVALHLWSWPALTLAIQNAWGGSAHVSNDKRDWMAGAVSELLTSTPPQLADVGDLEEVLLQVMLDEFEIVVDDGTAEDVARSIWSGATKLRNGDLAELNELYVKWQEKQQKGGDRVVAVVRGEDKDQDTDWDEDDEEEEEWNGFADSPDVDMDEAPPLNGARMPKQKMEPEVDEDGFTKVVGKKKR
ncbi:rRNA accumulation-related protein [Exophiala oligosperma]